MGVVTGVFWLCPRCVSETSPSLDSHPTSHPPLGSAYRKRLVDISDPDVCLLAGGYTARTSQGNHLQNQADSQMVATEAAVSCQISLYPNHETLMGSTLGRRHILGFRVSLVACG